MRSIDYDGTLWLANGQAWGRSAGFRNAFWVETGLSRAELIDADVTPGTRVI